jgi:hypothetical protein
VANVYFGDGVTSTTDNDWNNPANWYSTLGSIGGSCCPDTPGASYLVGGVPSKPLANDTALIVGGPTVSNITIGPTGNYFTGTIKWVNAFGRGPGINIAGGTWTNIASITIQSVTATINTGSTPSRIES